MSGHHTGIAISCGVLPEACMTALQRAYDGEQLTLTDLSEFPEEIGHDCLVDLLNFAAKRENVFFFFAIDREWHDESRRGQPAGIRLELAGAFTDDYDPTLFMLVTWLIGFAGGDGLVAWQFTTDGQGWRSPGLIYAMGKRRVDVGFATKEGMVGPEGRPRMASHLMIEALNAASAAAEARPDRSVPLLPALDIKAGTFLSWDELMKGN